MPINRNEFAGPVESGLVPAAAPNTRVVQALTAPENVVPLPGLGAPMPIIGRAPGIPAWVVPIVFPSSGTSLSIRVDYLQLKMPARLRGIAVSNGGTGAVIVTQNRPQWAFGIAGGKLGFAPLFLPEDMIDLTITTASASFASVYAMLTSEEQVPFFG